nr:methylamine utilization protein [Allopontixanthobacter confluentis]
MALPAATSLAAGGADVRIQLVDARGVPVRDAVVEISPASGPNASFRFPGRAAMAQKDLQFTPGTLVVAKGSAVVFPNLDRVRHSIYSFSRIARFEFDLYGRDQTRSRAFPITGSVALGCKIHDDMRGYIRVVDTPFAGKTDHNGIMTVSGVPGGMAKVTLWHPRLRAPGNETVSTVSVTGNLSRKFTVTLK